MNENLVALLLGALDDEEAARLREAIAADPALQAEHDEIRRHLALHERIPEVQPRPALWRSLEQEIATDAATHAEGFLLDDVEIPETGYFTDFETDDGGWEAAGFVRISNALPQTFRVSLITTSGATEYLELNPENQGEWIISLERGEEVVLVVSGTSRHTLQTARYDYEFVPYAAEPSS